MYRLFSSLLLTAKDPKSHHHLRRHQQPLYLSSLVPDLRHLESCMPYLLLLIVYKYDYMRSEASAIRTVFEVRFK